MATAMFRKAGVLQFTDTHQMVKTAITFSQQEAPPGRRVGIITNTGGPGIVMVDECIERGLELATWSDTGKERLKDSLYAEASLGNPVDVVATANADHYFAAVDTLLNEDGTDMVLVFFVTAPFTDTDAIARRIKEATDNSDKPVVIVVETFAKLYALIDKLRASGLPVFEFPEDGARSLAAMADYAKLRARPVADPPELDVDRAAAAKIIETYAGHDSYLPQTAAFAVLSAYGLPLPKVVAVTSEAELAAATASVGFPCVLKVDAQDVIHKSDAGGVILGLADLDAVTTAYRQLQEKFATVAASYLLMEQKPAGREIIIGAKAAPGLGSMLLFGLGGIFVEVMQDVVVAVAPLSHPEAMEMMQGIKGYPVLTGVRGEPSADLEAVADLLMRASRLAADFPAITEMDLNPIFIYEAGHDPAVVDVRIKVL